MINKVSKENKISFLELDYDQLAKEVADINDKYNRKEEKPMRMAQHKTGNPHKTQANNKINFLEVDVPTPETKKQTPINLEKPHKFDQSSGHANALSQSSYVGRLNDGTVKDTGGSGRGMKTRLSNSIWDSEVLQKLASEVTSKEKTNLIKQEKIDRKLAQQQKYQSEINNIAENIDTRGGATVTPLSQMSDKENRQTGPSTMSVWDFFAGKQDFNDIPEQTHGERAVQENKESREPKKEPRSQKPVTTKSMSEQLIENLLSTK